MPRLIVGRLAERRFDVRDPDRRPLTSTAHALAHQRATQRHDWEIFGPHGGERNAERLRERVLREANGVSESSEVGQQ